MTKEQWESQTGEARLKVQDNNPLKGIPLSSYENELLRRQEIDRRAKLLKLTGDDLEEALSAHSLKNGQIIPISAAERAKMDSSLAVLKEMAAAENKEMWGIKLDNLYKLGDLETIHSVKAMNYLTTGENYLIQLTMNNREAASAINSSIREIFITKDKSLHITEQLFLDIREQGYNTLQILDLIETKTINRGLKNMHTKLNFLNQSENMLNFINRAQ
jgi:hypothetical protein